MSCAGLTRASMMNFNAQFFKEIAPLRIERLYEIELHRASNA